MGRRKELGPRRRGGGEDEIRTTRRSNSNSLRWPTYIA